MAETLVWKTSVARCFRHCQSLTLAQSQILMPRSGMACGLASTDAFGPQSLSLWRKTMRSIGIKKHHLSQEGLGIHLIDLLLFSIRLPGDDGLLDVHIQRRCIPADHNDSADSRKLTQYRPTICLTLSDLSLRSRASGATLRREGRLTKSCGEHINGPSSW